MFPDLEGLGDDDVVAVGSDFSPSTLLLAYRSGIFPWPHEHIVAWFCPDPRAVFPLDREPRWSRSLRRTLKRRVLGDGSPFEVTIDRAFADVMRLCGETRPEGTWITPALKRGYTKLHELGWAHSVEVWTGGELVGGIYGVSIGALFAGESMFHLRTDASKVAFAELAALLRENGGALFDVQVLNPHLASLGCIEISRATYVTRVGEATRRSPIDFGIRFGASRRTEG